MTNRKTIKIFSTQRIDKKADLFDCESIVPVRCGAVYDTSTNPSVTGDNTGDNISARRMSFCELTTQYWAWKNEEADYYGFCHYRRYFSFAKKRFPSDAWRTVLDTYIDEDAQEKYEINDDRIEEAVKNYDILLPDAVSLKEVGIKSNYDQYGTSPFLHSKDIDLLLEIINELYPETSPYAEAYFNGSESIFCNMMIMKKEYFKRYSQWLFDILFEFEKRADMSEYSEEAFRTPGHLGERLLGVYCLYLKETEKVKIGRLQMVVFSAPEAFKTLAPAFNDGNTASIVLSSSLYYTPYCASTVKSIIDTSNDNHNYDIIILHTEIPQKTQRLFFKMIENRSNFSIRFCDVRRIVSKFNLRICEHFSVETYYRLAIKEFLPKYKKVVYLDSDLIVKRDIFELYSTDITGYAVAGVTDICLSGINNGYNKDKATYYKEYAFIADRNLLKMINAGVMVMNLDFINAKYSAKQLLTYAQESNFELCDQDVINSLFQDNILLLDFRWNTADYEEETLPAWCTKFAPKNMVEEYRKAVKDPYILHYASTIKPWNETGYKNADVFWSTVRTTPFYEYLLCRRMQENASYYAGTVGAATVHKKQKPPKEKLWRRLADKFYPKGTRRRERLKKFVCFVTRKKYIKPYYPVV